MTSATHGLCPDLKAASHSAASGSGSLSLLATRATGLSFGALIAVSLSRGSAPSDGNMNLIQAPGAKAAAAGGHDRTKPS